MPLPDLEEPRELKKMIKELSTVMGSGRGLLLYNKLPQYIWTSWSAELKKMGLDWREFLKMVSEISDLIAGWAIEERISWGELLSNLRELALSRIKARTERRVGLEAFTRREG